MTTMATRVGSMTFTMPTDTSLVGTRHIDAPRELVWAAHTECEHVREWLIGPAGWSMPVCDIDLQPGGRYRYVYEGPDAPSFQMSGIYREVKPPERLVNSERMDTNPAETVNTMTLTEEAGGTRVETVVEYPSAHMREELLATGMLDGWAESYDRLEDYLASLG